VTVSAEKDRNVIQALAHVARLGEYTLASVGTSDDAQKRVLTVKFIGVSAGFVQETLPWDDATPLIAHANGRGEVESIEGSGAGLQPGDLAETADEAEKEIAGAEAEAEVIEGEDPDAEPPRDPGQPFVGELAAAAKQNRKQR